jgi:CRP/FNR family transcriptional regulator
MRPRVAKDAMLQAFGFYEDATESERRRIGDAVDLVHLMPGEVFLREGEAARAFGLVHRGDIRVFRTAPNGREVTLYHVRDGQACLVNMLSVFLQRDALASAVVAAPTDALVIPADVFRKLLTTNGTLQWFAFGTVAARLTDVMMLVEEVTVRRMDARLASWLLRTAAIQRDKTTIPLTHDALAVELGTAREVVSRLLKDFERKGAIRLRRGRVLLLDDRILSDIAADGANRV